MGASARALHARSPFDSPSRRSEFAQGRLSLRLKNGYARDDAIEKQTSENQTEPLQQPPPSLWWEPGAGIQRLKAHCICDVRGTHECVRRYESHFRRGVLDECRKMQIPHRPHRASAANYKDFAARLKPRPFKARAIFPQPARRTDY